MHPELSVSANLSLMVKQQSGESAKIGAFGNLFISSVRSTSHQFESLLPCTVLNQFTNLQRLVGTAKATFELEDKQMEFQDLTVHIKEEFGDSLNIAGWQLTGVGIQVDSFSDSSPIFLSKDMNDRKRDLRSMLFDLSPEKDSESNAID